jgi:hypothetical protein
MFIIVSIEAKLHRSATFLRDPVPPVLESPYLDAASGAACEYFNADLGLALVRRGAPGVYRSFLHKLSLNWQFRPETGRTDGGDGPSGGV